MRSALLRLAPHEIASALKSDTAEVGIAEVYIDEFGMAEVGHGELGINEDGMAQVGNPHSASAIDSTW